MSIDTFIAGTATWLWGRYADRLLDKMGNLLVERARKASEVLADAAAAKLRDGVKTKWQDFKWDQAASDYASRMRAEYNKMRILGMLGPVPLENIFTDVLILDKITSWQRRSLEELLADQDRPASHQAGSRRGALEVLNQHHRLFLLGKPGAGKTTLMKWLVIQSTGGRLDKTPIFVTLKDWSDSGEKDLLTFVTTQFEIHGFPDAGLFVQALLAEGDAILLLDGLDEVNLEGGKRDHATQSVRNFAKKFPKAPCVITCRIAESEYVFEDFTYVELADFTPEQAECFAANWFGSNQQLSESFQNEFRKEQNRDLRDLARTPLLLTLLCLNYQETLHFPKRRVEIYEEAVSALLVKWDSSRMIHRDNTYKTLSLGHKRQLLHQIAAEYFQEGRIFFERRDLCKKIATFLKPLPGPASFDESTAEDVLRAIEAQHGLLISRASSVYSFSHKTFQEYFTAKYIEANPLSSTLRGLVEHAHDDGWHEVLLLCASLLPARQAAELFAQWVKLGQEVLSSSEGLMTIAKWVNRKANRGGEAGSYGSGLRRSIYHFLALDLDRDIAIDRLVAAELINALSPYGNHSLTGPDCTFLAVSRDPGIAIDIRRGLEHIRLGGSNLDIGLRHLYRAGMDGLIAGSWSEFEFAAAFKEASYHLLRNNEPWGEAWLQLVPPNTDSATEWRFFLRSFRELLQAHADLAHDFVFTAAELVQLKNYHSSTLRMLECLEVAAVTDRQAIRDSVFSLPPDSSSS